jgi:hypothetical protein
MHHHHHRCWLYEEKIIAEIVRGVGGSDSEVVPVARCAIFSEYPLAAVEEI